MRLPECLKYEQSYNDDRESLAFRKWIRLIPIVVNDVVRNVEMVRRKLTPQFQSRYSFLAYCVACYSVKNIRYGKTSTWLYPFFMPL